MESAIWVIYCHVEFTHFAGTFYTIWRKHFLNKENHFTLMKDYDPYWFLFHDNLICILVYLEELFNDTRQSLIHAIQCSHVSWCNNHYSVKILIWNPMENHSRVYLLSNFNKSNCIFWLKNEWKLMCLPDFFFYQKRQDGTRQDIMSWAVEKTRKLPMTAKDINIIM